LWYWENAELARRASALDWGARQRGHGRNADSVDGGPLSGVRILGGHIRQPGDPTIVDLNDDLPCFGWVDGQHVSDHRRKASPGYYGRRRTIGRYEEVNRGAAAMALPNDLDVEKLCPKLGYTGKLHAKHGSKDASLGLDELTWFVQSLSPLLHDPPDCNAHVTFGHDRGYPILASQLHRDLRRLCRGTVAESGRPGRAGPMHGPPS